MIVVNLVNEIAILLPGNLTWAASKRSGFNFFGLS